MATKYGGYMGKILQIDLTTETAKEYPFTDQQRKETLGGKMLADHILSSKLTGRERPFSEENLVIFSTGPFTGTGAPGSIRFDITALSPKTGLPSSSNCGGSFGLYLKKAGFDALILSGRCKTHRWREIREDQIQFHDAHTLWGSGIGECRKMLSDRLDYDAYSCLCIGSAGEYLLPAATVISDGRAAGRAGFGAVLGWKNLKAITVTGNKAIPLSDPVLNDLGIDSIDAGNHLTWLREKHGVTLENTSASKCGQRRNKFYHSILESLEIQDCAETYQAYQNLTEIISASGLCIFSVISCLDIQHDSNPFTSSDQLSRLLRYSTGMCLLSEALMAIDNYNRELKIRYCKKRITLPPFPPLSIHT